MERRRSIGLFDSSSSDEEDVKDRKGLFDESVDEPVELKKSNKSMLQQLQEQVCEMKMVQNSIVDELEDMKKSNRKAFKFFERELRHLSKFVYRKHRNDVERENACSTPPAYETMSPSAVHGLSPLCTKQQFAPSEKGTPPPPMMHQVISSPSRMSKGRLPLHVEVNAGTPSMENDTGISRMENHPGSPKMKNDIGSIKTENDAGTPPPLQVSPKNGQWVDSPKQWSDDGGKRKGWDTLREMNKVGSPKIWRADSPERVQRDNMDVEEEVAYSTPPLPDESSNDMSDEDVVIEEKIKARKPSTQFDVMNDYLKSRSAKRRHKMENVAKKKKEAARKERAYQEEWEALAKAEKERKANLHKHRQKRRSGSGKNIRLSMRRQMQKERGDKKDDKKVDVVHEAISESEEDESDEECILPPEPSEADMELYRRQQARLKTLFEENKVKREEESEANVLRGQVADKMKAWKAGKSIAQMLRTQHEFSAIPQLSDFAKELNHHPSPEELRKAYRNTIRIIHPDKLRGVTIKEKLEAQELFAVVTQAYEKSKSNEDNLG